MSIVGTRVVRREDRDLITAGGTYVDDLRSEALSGAAHAVFVRSPIAHARIGGIDVSAAKEAPGVLGVFTAADLGLAPHPSGPVPEPWLAGEVVRYVGEPVALVVTEERYQLADAAVDASAVESNPLVAALTEIAAKGTTPLLPGVVKSADVLTAVDEATQKALAGGDPAALLKAAQPTVQDALSAK